MKKIIFISTFFALFSTILAAETVTGRVVDSLSLQPIEFVTVTVFNPTTNKTAGGAISNQDGVFNISSIQNGAYELRVSFVGYNSYSRRFTMNGSDLKLGDVLLAENTTVLKEVEVVGQGSQMRFDIDKKVFSVDQNIASAGGSATDVLQNIPSVDVDNDGNISLRNNTSVEIWINGKPSGLTAENRAQILQQMPAENLESIEIMTNPSAKFNPEGKAGVINLVMKKNRKAGYYGSVSAGATVENGKFGYNTGVSINYNVGKFDTYANVGFRNSNSLGYGFNERKNFNNGDTTILTQRSTSDFSMNGLFFRSGVDYHIDSKNTIGVGGMGYFGSPNSTTNTDYLWVEQLSNNKLRDYSRNNVSTDGHNGKNFDLYHKIEFDKLGSNLITDIIYSSHSNAGNMRYKHTDRLITGNQQDVTQKSDAVRNGWEIKSDLTKKFNENSRLEVGWSSRWNTRVSESTAFNNLLQAPINEYFNHFDYKEQIHALYATYGTRFNNFSASAGLRGEYFLSESTTTPAPANVIQPIETKYFELFPSIYLSYALPRNSEIQLNYTRRIDRPRGWYINPFRNYSDSTNITYGNPALLPEFESSFELNYIKNWDNHTLSSTIYYKFDKDDVEGVSFMNNGVMESTYMNLLNDHNVGVELISKNRFFKILNLTSTLNFYYNRLDASVYQNPLNPSIRIELPQVESFSWDARMIANLMFTSTFSGQLTGQYSSFELQSQGERYPRYAIDMGLRKTFLDRKLSLSFNVRDIFNTRRYKGKTWGEGFSQYYDNQRRARMFGLTLTYNFGNMKPKPVDRPRPSDSSNGEGDMNME